MAVFEPDFWYGQLGDVVIADIEYSASHIVGILADAGHIHHPFRISMHPVPAMQANYAKHA